MEYVCYTLMSNAKSTVFHILVNITSVHIPKDSFLDRKWLRLSSGVPSFRTGSSSRSPRLSMAVTRVAPTHCAT
jgi:hypothetical protein